MQGTTFHFLSLGVSFSSVGISLAHALAELRMGDYCLGQHLGGQFWEVVWTLRDPGGFEPWMSIAAVLTIHHFNDFPSFTGPLSLFLHSCLRSPPELTTCITSLSWTLLLRETNIIHFFFYCRGGERMGLSDSPEEISQQGSFLSQ